MQYRNKGEFYKVLNHAIKDLVERGNCIDRMYENYEYKYHIITYGCQMNVHDSEKLAGMLDNLGYIQTNDKSNADLIIFNTCCVRDHAEQKVYGNIGRLKEQKKNNPDLIIAVCGCMMQQDGIAEELVKKFAFIDLVFGTHNLYEFPSLLSEAIETNRAVVKIQDSMESVSQEYSIKRNNKVSAWVTIMYGCDNYCSYCIVPYVRGRERSRPRIEILSEIEKLASEGFKEVYLLGQNVNSYSDTNSYMFPDLLTDINKIDGIERIRFISSHPKDLSKEMILSFDKNEKICEHIHLPIQSGSDNILQKMNRKYDTRQFMGLIEEIKRVGKRVAVTTDIIVGFPGETEEDFEDTIALMKNVEFDAAYTFMYSARKGTPAAGFPDQIELSVKKSRLEELNKIQAEISGKINRQYQDKTVEVLVEGLSKGSNEMFTGRTRDNKLVHFKAKENEVGQLVKVKITQTKPWTLEGIVE